MIKKLFIINFILAGLMFAWPVSAASPSPTPKPSPSASPTSSPTPTEVTTLKLKERIQKVINEKKDQVKGVLSDLSGQRRGFIGEVQRVSAEAITLKTSKGVEIISVEPGLSLIKKGKLIKVDEISVGDWVVGIGLIENDNLIVKKLIVSTTSLRPRGISVTLGNIKSLSKTELTINHRNGSGTITYMLNKNTSYQDLEGNKIDFKKVTPDMQCLAVGLNNDNGVIQATAVRILTTVK